MNDPFSFTKISAPMFRDHCNITETEMRILSLHIASNIAEAIEEDYIIDYLNIHNDIGDESLLENLFHITNDIKSYCIFDKYTKYFSDNITFRLFPLTELLTMLPRLMIYMQIIFYNLINIKEENKANDFVYDTLSDFDKYKKWTSDFGYILEYICNVYVNEIIEQYNNVSNKEKNYE